MKILPFPECHASTIAELDNGDLVTAFFGGTKERNPDVCIWVCRKSHDSNTWTAPIKAADGVFDLDDPDAAIAGVTADIKIIVKLVVTQSCFKFREATCYFSSK